MRQRLAFTLTLLIVSSPISASAQEEQAPTADVEPDYARTGPYVGVGFVYAFENFDLGSAENLTGVGLDASDSLGFDLRGGYRFHPHVAVEADFQSFARFEVESSGENLLHASAWTLLGNLKFFALTGRLQPYAQFGLGALYAEIDDDGGLGITESEVGFVLRGGGGLDAYVTENFLLNLEVGYVLPATKLRFQGASVDAAVIPLSFNAQYRF